MSLQCLTCTCVHLCPPFCFFCGENPLDLLPMSESFSWGRELPDDSNTTRLVQWTFAVDLRLLRTHTDTPTQRHWLGSTDNEITYSTDETDNSDQLLYYWHSCSIVYTHVDFSATYSRSPVHSLPGAAKHNAGSDNNSTTRSYDFCPAMNSCLWWDWKSAIPLLERGCYCRS